jgi:trans-aconitate methyltransferase
VELAAKLECRMQTPERIDSPSVRVRFQKLDRSRSFHLDNSGHEKYGTASLFGEINKHEEPAFAWAYDLALREVGIAQTRRLLDLGVNTGGELAHIEAMLGADHGIEMVGIDHSHSALDVARSRCPSATFYRHDINDLAALGMGRFDLLLTIGTLQSPGIETKPLVMDLVQHYLTDDSALIIGFPNSRWIDGELIQGAKAPNYPFSELSLLIKDIHWIKKYLQQHRYRVRIFGRSYLWLVATRISKPNKV